MNWMGQTYDVKSKYIREIRTFIYLVFDIKLKCLSWLSFYSIVYSSGLVLTWEYQTVQFIP